MCGFVIFLLIFGVFDLDNVICVLDIDEEVESGILVW